MKTNLGHANDCTYYDGLYFVATANKGKNIYAFYKDTLKKEGEYSWNCSNLDRVSSIAHYYGNYFLLSKKDKVSLCALIPYQKAFQEINAFTLKQSNSNISIDIDSLTPQGMWSDGSNIFKVFSKHESDGGIKTNYIAKWDVNNLNSASLENVYSYTDSSERYLFEIESISATSNQMYAAVKTQAQHKTTNYGASLYAIRLEK